VGLTTQQNIGDWIELDDVSGFRLLLEKETAAVISY
jgi:hypothetical protein